MYHTDHHVINNIWEIVTHVYCWCGDWNVILIRRLTSSSTWCCWSSGKDDIPAAFLFCFPSLPVMMLRRSPELCGGHSFDVWLISLKSSRAEKDQTFWAAAVFFTTWCLLLLLLLLLWMFHLFHPLLWCFIRFSSFSFLYSFLLWLLQ